MLATKRFLSLILFTDGKRIKLQIWDTAGQERYETTDTDILLTGFNLRSAFFSSIHAQCCYCQNWEKQGAVTCTNARENDVLHPRNQAKHF